MNARLPIFCLLWLLNLAACGTIDDPCPQAMKGDVVYVVEQGWHVDIGIPMSQLDENLAFYREVYPGARVIMFGYGKKTFFTAPADDVREYLLGPFPGPAVIHTFGLRVSGSEAYPGDTITLALPPGGSRALSEFIWKDLTKDSAGKPIIVAHSTEPDGIFYAAGSEYNLLHTCNTWAADALHTSGIDTSGDGVIFSGQAVSRIEEAADAQCHTGNPSN